MILKNMWLKEVYGRLSMFKRFRDTPTICQESIAEHSYFVVLITEKLCDYFGVSHNTKLHAIEMAIYHDISESFSDDFTYEIKYKVGSRAFRKALAVIESSILQELSEKMASPKILGLNEEYKDRKSVESRIVKLADWY
ncbi:MAG: hypothetical protein DRZ76_02795, partial [Candidatus Nealsonbacteria bacterium]